MQLEHWKDDILGSVVALLRWAIDVFNIEV